MNATKELHAELWCRKRHNDGRVFDASAINVALLNIPARGNVNAEDGLLGVIELGNDPTEAPTHWRLEGIPEDGVHDQVTVAEMGFLKGGINGDVVNAKLLDERLKEGCLALLGIDHLRSVTKVDQVPCTNKSVATII